MRCFYFICAIYLFIYCPFSYAQVSNDDKSKGTQSTISNQSIQEFDIEQKFPSETTWAEGVARIYYIVGGTWGSSDLYAINTDGSNMTKIIDGLVDRIFGWSPTGSKMFAVTKNGLIIMSPEGKNQEKVFDIQIENADSFRPSPLYLGPQRIQWSPDEKFLLYLHNMKSLDYYVINLSTKEKIKFFERSLFNKLKQYPKDAIQAIFWSKDSKRIYIFNTNFTSANDFTDQVLTYDLTSKKIEKIREGNERTHGATYSWSFLESVRDDIFFTRKNFDSAFRTFDLKETNGIKIVDEDGFIVLKKKLSKDGQVLDSYKLCQNWMGSGKYHNFFWLTGDRYIIFQFGDTICILDPQEMKVGRLVRGSNFGWFDKRGFTGYETHPAPWMNYY